MRVRVLILALLLSNSVDWKHFGNCGRGDDKKTSDRDQLFRNVSGCGGLARWNVRNAHQSRLSPFR